MVKGNFSNCGEFKSPRTVLTEEILNDFGSNRLESPDCYPRSALIGQKGCHWNCLSGKEDKRPGSKSLRPVILTDGAAWNQVDQKQNQEQRVSGIAGAGQESSYIPPAHEMASNTANLRQIGMVRKPSSDKDLVDTFSASNHMGVVASEGDPVGYENQLPTKPQFRDIQSSSEVSNTRKLSQPVDKGGSTAKCLMRSSASGQNRRVVGDEVEVQEVIKGPGDGQSSRAVQVLLSERSQISGKPLGLHSSTIGGVPPYGGQEPATGQIDSESFFCHKYKHLVRPEEGKTGQTGGTQTDDQFIDQLKYFNGENLLEHHDRMVSATNKIIDLKLQDNPLMQNPEAQFVTFEYEYEGDGVGKDEKVNGNAQFPAERDGQLGEVLESKCGTLGESAFKQLPVYERMQVYASQKERRLKMLHRQKDLRESQEIKSRPSILKKSQKLVKNRQQMMRCLQGGGIDGATGSRPASSDKAWILRGSYQGNYRHQHRLAMRYMNQAAGKPVPGKSADAARRTGRGPQEAAQSIKAPYCRNPKEDQNDNGNKCEDSRPASLVNVVYNGYIGQQFNLNQRTDGRSASNSSQRRLRVSSDPRTKQAPRPRDVPVPGEYQGDKALQGTNSGPNMGIFNIDLDKFVQEQPETVRHVDRILSCNPTNPQGRDEFSGFCCNSRDGYGTNQEPSKRPASYRPYQTQPGRGRTIGQTDQWKQPSKPTLSASSPSSPLHASRARSSRRKQKVWSPTARQALNQGAAGRSLPAHSQLSPGIQRVIRNFNNRNPGIKVSQQLRKPAKDGMDREPSGGAQGGHRQKASTATSHATQPLQAAAGLNLQKCSEAHLIERSRFNQFRNPFSPTSGRVEARSNGNYASPRSGRLLSAEAKGTRGADLPVGISNQENRDKVPDKKQSIKECTGFPKASTAANKFKGKSQTQNLRCFLTAARELPGFGKVPNLESYSRLQLNKQMYRSQQKFSQEMEGFTGRPQINRKSKSITRKIDDLYNWKQNVDKKCEYERNLKRLQEEQEFQKMQNRKVMSKKSQIYAERWSARAGKQDSKSGASPQDLCQRPEEMQEQRGGAIQSIRGQTQVCKKMELLNQSCKPFTIESQPNHYQTYQGAPPSSVQYVYPSKDMINILSLPKAEQPFERLEPQVNLGPHRDESSAATSHVAERRGSSVTWSKQGHLEAAGTRTRNRGVARVKPSKPTPSSRWPGAHVGSSKSDAQGGSRPSNQRSSQRDGSLEARCSQFQPERLKLRKDDHRSSLECQEAVLQTQSTLQEAAEADQAPERAKKQNAQSVNNFSPLQELDVAELDVNEDGLLKKMKSVRQCVKQNRQRRQHLQDFLFKPTKLEGKETAGSPRGERASMKPGDNMLEIAAALDLGEPSMERYSGTGQFGTKQWAERCRSSPGRTDSCPEDSANLKSTHRSRRASSGLPEANRTLPNARLSCKERNPTDWHNGQESNQNAPSFQIAGDFSMFQQYLVPSSQARRTATTGSHQGSQHLKQGRHGQRNVKHRHRPFNPPEGDFLHQQSGSANSTVLYQHCHMPKATQLTCDMRSSQQDDLDYPHTLTRQQDLIIAKILENDSNVNRHAFSQTVRLGSFAKEWRDQGTPNGFNNFGLETGASINFWPRGQDEPEPSQFAGKRSANHFHGKQELLHGVVDLPKQYQRNPFSSTDRDFEDQEENLLTEGSEMLGAREEGSTRRKIRQATSLDRLNHGRVNLRQYNVQGDEDYCETSFIPATTLYLSQASGKIGLPDSIAPKAPSTPKIARSAASSSVRPGLSDSETGPRLDNISPELGEATYPAIHTTQTTPQDPNIYYKN